MTLEGDFTRDAPVPGTPEPGGLPEMGVFETATGKPVPKPRETRIQAAQAGSATANMDPWPEHVETMNPRKLAENLGLPLAEEQPPHEREEGRKAVLLATGAVGHWARHQAGGELVFMVPSEDALHAAQQAMQGQEPYPVPEPVRIDYGRTKAHQLGLPYTPDMKMSEVEDGMRAVDGMARVGAFHRQPGKHGDGEEYERMLFVPDAVTPEQARAAADEARERTRERVGGIAPFGNARDNPIYYYAPTTWTRNGRETGAWIAGLATRQQFCRVKLLTEHVDGAVTSLVAAGMLVGRHGRPKTDLDPVMDGEDARSYTMLDVECPPSLAGTF